MKKTILIFGGISVVILMLFQLERWSLFALGGSQNLYTIITGVLFLILGIAISRHFNSKKIAYKKQKLHSILSNQEHQVLKLIAQGMSNKEIAGQLFIAETTVKTHVSKILSKLDARRRTEAVRIGREVGIL